MNSLNHFSAVSNGSICGGFLKAYAERLTSEPKIFLLRAILTPLITSSITEHAFGASTVLNRKSSCIGVFAK